VGVTAPREIFQYCRIIQQHVGAYLNIVSFQNLYKERYWVRSSLRHLKNRPSERYTRSKYRCLMGAILAESNRVSMIRVRIFLDFVIAQDGGKRNLHFTFSPQTLAKGVNPLQLGDRRQGNTMD